MKAHSRRITLSLLGSLITGLAACSLPFDGEEPTTRTHTVVLFATPKFIRDFDNPGPDIASFLQHYEPLTSRAAETIVIFAVGNSDHVLQYRGPSYWADELEWARWTEDWIPFSEQTMTYRQIAGIVEAFNEQAEELGIELKVYDQVDKGREFAHVHWRYSRHPECHDTHWDAYNIRGIMTRDDRIYASAPAGLAAGTQCGRFLVDQVGHYLRDMGFDGILYGNQLGTRGGWLPDNGPGYSDDEARAILEFLKYSRQVYGEKELMWFDSYNTVQIEHDVYSFPSDGYQYFDYIIVSGFAVITFPERYLDNLHSKLPLRGQTKLLATLDYVDPWYFYNSMTEFPGESARLEQIAIAYRDSVDGLVFFANDHEGKPVPGSIIESFARRFFSN